jgi:hypothetical protein
MAYSAWHKPLQLSLPLNLSILSSTIQFKPMHE